MRLNGNQRDTHTYKTVEWKVKRDKRFIALLYNNERDTHRQTNWMTEAQGVEEVVI